MNKNSIKKLTANNELINTKFEGYKLQPFPEETNLCRTALPGGRLQINKLPHNNRMGFRELQARIRFSHLADGFPLNDHTGTAFYVDDEYAVVMILFDKVTRSTEFFQIAQLVRPLNSVPSYTIPDQEIPLESQYPSVIALNSGLVLACNGIGDIELIGLEAKSDNTVAGAVVASASYEGDTTEGMTPVPCVLLSAKIIKEKIVMIVHSRASGTKTVFNIATLEMDLPNASSVRRADGVYESKLTTLHIQQGPEVPVYHAITNDGDHCILGSEVRYETIRGLATDADVEMEPVCKTDGVAPYEWMQDDSEISMEFAIPVGVSKNAVTCNFTRDHLSLIVQEKNFTLSYPFRKLWSAIRPDESTWTIDSTAGKLTVSLAKHDEHTRWPHVFEMDDGNLEKVDPSRLQTIAERLEKFTSDVDEENPPTTAFVQAMQHPAATDMDEDIDEGREPVLFVVYNRHGQKVDEISSGNNEWICRSFDTHRHHRVLPTFCVKDDVDGTVYALNFEDEELKAKHIATFNAFAFVQASKRDSRFIHYDLLNQFVTIVESTRNAYIYYRSGEKNNVERQTLVDLTQGHATDVIGAQLILDRLLMVLTEDEIIVMEI
ncbi:uncharacterized protein BYT42DRAFT_549719 [Radiomyces spectabilis]|uniref:uncharacterized protein n=1 Tax=Radiomyces spectabilis TaxID=64574 RepID=UPI00221F8009|nr:uncharacterized protein BYT42DRAFT_549719 [Radiomyces spectabilis]KAI8366627.1 hypothetical protein BYT42DRAFT_549719 [Radiomyces spectabilis]